MNNRTAQFLFLALTVALATGGCATTLGGADRAFVIPAEIEAADSRSEHERLAAQYDELSASARRQAEAHRGMLKSYQSSTFAHRYQKPGHIPVMERHCEELITNADEAARVYSEMAAQHREWAKDAPEATPAGHQHH